MSRDPRREGRKALCPEAHLLPLLGSSWAVDAKKLTREASSHKRSSQVGLSGLFCPPHNHQGSGSFHLFDPPFLSLIPASWSKIAAWVPTITSVFQLGVGRRKHVLPPFEGIPRKFCSFIPLVRTESHSTDSCKVQWEMFLFFFRQVAMCPDKSKGSTAVEEKDGILGDPTKNM